MKIYDNPDYSLNKKCLDCKKPISNRAKKCSSCAMKGKSFTEEHKRKISESRKGHNNGHCKENHYKWITGIPKGYKTIHKRIQKMYGKASVCVDCDCEGKCKKYEWSNKDHKYDSLKLDKWQSLCQVCHIKYDRIYNENI